MSTNTVSKVVRKSCHGEHNSSEDEHKTSPILTSRKSPTVRGQRLSKRPYICRFKTDDKFYVYDVNKNSIINVDEVTYKVVKDFGAVSIDDLAERYKGSFSKEQITRAYKSIELLREQKGIFTNNRPSQIMHPLDENALRLIYEERLQSIVFELTEQCNLRCSYCAYSGTYESFRPHNGKYMTFETAKKGVDLLRANSKLCDFVKISFYGGEPLIGYKLLLQIVNYTNEIFGRKPVEFHMTTNATLLTEEVAKFLIKNEFHLLISLDGPKDLHDRHRRNAGNSGTFDLIEKNLTRLKELDHEYYNKNVAFNFVVAPPYHSEILEKFVSESPLLSKNRVRTSYVNPQDTTFYDRFTNQDLDLTGFEKMKVAYNNAIASGAANLDSTMSKYKLGKAMFGDNIDKVAGNLKPSSSFGEVYHPGGICIPGMKKLMITGAGKLYTCEKSSTTSDLLCLGTLDEGLNPAKGMANIGDYSRAHDVCKFCFASRNCGTCFVTAYTGGKFNPETKKKQCDSNRYSLKRNLTSIMSIREKNSDAFQYLKNISFTI